MKRANGIYAGGNQDGGAFGGARKGAPGRGA